MLCGGGGSVVQQLMLALDGTVDVLAALRDRALRIKVVYYRACDMLS